MADLVIVDVQSQYERVQGRESTKFQIVRAASHGVSHSVSHTSPLPFAMTSLLNITGSRVVEDPSFRYKMPRLVCRIEGRGNGIRTCIVNLSDVSSALNRPPDILTKYFGVELGAQSRYEMDVSVLTRV
jgi:translation initiation factor 2 beta subunit (eIF-2beta)/eIF-5